MRRDDVYSAMVAPRKKIMLLDYLQLKPTRQSTGTTEFIILHLRILGIRQEYWLVLRQNIEQVYPMELHYSTEQSFWG